MRITKLNQVGDHFVIIAAFIVLFGVAGTFFLLHDHAAGSYSLLKLSLGGQKVCLDNQGNGTGKDNVIIWNCNSNDAAQQWQLTPYNGGLQIQDSAGTCLDDWGGASGNVLFAAKCYNSDRNQTWSWNNRTLVNAASHGCINDTGQNTNQGTRQIIYNCSGTPPNEQWYQVGVGSSSGGGNTGSINANAICTHFHYSGNLAVNCNNVKIAASWIAGNISSWDNQTQFECLGELWNAESTWDSYMQNKASGAFGIAQALGHGGQPPYAAAVTAYVQVHYPGYPSPGDESSGKVAVNEYPSYFANYGLALYQIIWGLHDYIGPTYGSPCAAWNHEQNVHWYIQTLGPDGKEVRS